MHRAWQPKKVLFGLTSFIVTVMLAACGGGSGGGDNGRDPILGGVVATLIPTVTAVTPQPFSTNVPVNTRVVTAAFSKPMDATTITAANFLLACPTGTGIVGVVSYTPLGNVAVLTLSNDLPAATLCTATVTTGVRDTIGNTIPQNFIWTFTTGAAIDRIPPTVSSIFPLANATNVAFNAVITAAFSEPMDPLSINATNLRLACPATASTTVSVGYTVLGNVATLVPATNLPPATTCVVTVTTGVRDVAGNQMVLPFVWSFTTGPAPDTVAPTVTSTIPVANASGVAVNSTITATFSEAMNPLTISTANVKLSCPATNPIVGTVGYAVSGNVATFTPLASLPASTLCTATITSGVTDVAGNRLAADFVWSFTTAAAPDTVRPTVSTVVPANNATGVALNTLVTAAFSEPMNPLTITAASFSLACPATTPVLGTVGYASTGNIATFTPTLPLPASTLCTATITTGVTDVAGNAMAAPFVWSFTTGVAPDIIPPTVASTSPVANAVGVALNALVSATFSEPMDPLTITNVSFRLACPGTTNLTGSVAYASAGRTATFTPTVNMPASTICTATIANTVRDVAGNAMVAPFVWSFTTGPAPDTIPPTVIATTPASNAVNVPTNTQIVATFSEAMNPLTITTGTVRLACPAGVSVTGTVSYQSPANTATFTPTTVLPANTTCTGTVTTGTQDTAGNALAADFVWTFTTAAAADTIPPTVIATNPASNAVNVPTNTLVVATFSEAMNPLTITAATVRLACPVGVSVTGTVTYQSPANTATFTPTTALPANTTCTGTVTTGARDVAGNALVTDFVWTFTTAPVIVPPFVSPITLGAAAAYGGFGGSAGITNQGVLTVINGSIGTTAVSTAVTGFHSNGPGCTYTETTLNIGLVTGAINTAPPPPTVACPSEGTAVTFAAATAARAAALAAYNQMVAAPGGPDPGAGNLGSLTLAPGNYTAAAGSFRIQGGNLTLDAQGNANATWIFQMATTLTVGGPGAAFPQSVILTNGAQAKNVFWQVGSAATINAGGGGTMVGTIISQAGVAISTAGNVAIVTLNGRALSLGASVTMVNTVINVPGP